MKKRVIEHLKRVRNIVKIKVIEHLRGAQLLINVRIQVNTIDTQLSQPKRTIVKQLLAADTPFDKKVNAF